MNVETNMLDQDQKLKVAKKQLEEILKGIGGLDCWSRSFKTLEISSKVQTIWEKRSSSRKHFWKLVTLICVVVYFFAKNFFESTVYQKCLVGTPDFFQKVFRPPVDCSMCLDVQQVEKISAIDPDDFEEKYAYTGRPVVVTDATRDWLAIKSFSYSFFKRLYQNRQANCQFFPYKTGFQSLQDVFNMTNDRVLLKPGSEPWYVGWSNCDEDIGNILRKYYHRPYFLPTTAETEKTDWIFMGSVGYGAPMHVDDVDHPSWQAQIKGSKLWILEPPKECHYTCRRLEVIVDPGDIIVLDTNRWYHQTRIISEELSITIGAEYD